LIRRDGCKVEILDLATSWPLFKSISLCFSHGPQQCGPLVQAVCHHRVTCQCDRLSRGKVSHSVTGNRRKWTVTLWQRLNQIS